MYHSNEPMSMGSPTNYGFNRHSSPPQQQQSPYLPAYLMGEPSYTVSQSPSSRAWSNTVAVTPSRTTNLRRSMTTATTPYDFRNNHSRRDTLREPVSNRASAAPVNTRKNEKPSAPPVMGLMESFTGNSSLPFRADEPDCSNLSLSRSFSRGALGTSVMQNQTFADMDGSHHVFNSSHHRNIMSPAQIDPFYQHGESVCVDDVYDDTWVTVFGFPPAQTSFILQEFSQYGTIVKHVIAPNGNWLRIQYQSKLQAKKALSKNGKVFGGSVMVGVTACIDKDVMCDPGPIAGPIAEPIAPASITVNDTPLRNKLGRSASMRPLTSAYTNGRDPQATGKRMLPRKNTNVLSKAMEYVFGW